MIRLLVDLLASLMLFNQLALSLPVLHLLIPSHNYT
jgi:hypothetical protein